MPADSNSLTFILQQFLTAFQAGRGAVGVDAFHLLSILATLELTVAAIWWALVGDDVLVALMKKLLLVSHAGKPLSAIAPVRSIRSSNYFRASSRGASWRS